jgi:hypothetical protein
MSEFKFACPVCGQHMKCDSSQSGSTMECPTCFQKIIAPQAPASDDQKFILTGTKAGERPTPSFPTGSAPAAPAKTFPVAAVVLLALVCAAGAAVFALRGKIFKPGGNGVQTSETAPASAESSPPKTPTTTKPKVTAPPANDTNWTLALDAAAIPDTTAAGRIHGQDFIVERANFQNGTLTLRAGTRGAVEFGVFINFSGAQAEVLSGKTINVSTNADKAARVSFRWKDANGAVQKGNFDDSYALRLEFGALTNNRLPGKIYLCTPDPEKSYLMGTFNADAHKPKPKAPPKT